MKLFFYMKWVKNHKYKFYVYCNIISTLKVVSATFLLVCSVCLKENTCETRKNVFLFHFEGTFRSRDNQILEL